MPKEPQIIADFPKCPACGSETKVSDYAVVSLRESGKLAKDAFTQLRQEVSPLETPVMAGVLVLAVATCYDACGKCGTPRVTRAYLQSVPVQFQGMPSNGRGRMGN